MSALKIVFAGTPEFAQTALKALIAAGHEISLVMTQPDRRAGRGMKLQPSAVKQTALAHQIEVLQPTSLKLDGRYAEEALAAKEMLQNLQPDLMIVAAYGLILPTWALELPRYGCMNIHASLLPRWRGAAPIHRAIEAGDTKTGITIMQMDEGLDTGDMLLTSELEILPEDTTATLHDRLAVLGGNLMVKALTELDAGRLKREPQDNVQANYAAKIEKAESLVNWNDSAKVIERRIRAFDPFPGVTTVHQGVVYKIWGAQVLSDAANVQKGRLGEIVQINEDGVTVQTGDGLLQLQELQRPGGKRQSVHEFLQAVPLQKGELFGESF